MIFTIGHFLLSLGKWTLVSLCALFVLILATVVAVAFYHFITGLPGRLWAWWRKRRSRAHDTQGVTGKGIPREDWTRFCRELESLMHEVRETGRERGQ